MHYRALARRVGWVGVQVGGPGRSRGRRVGSEWRLEGRVGVEVGGSGRNGGWRVGSESRSEGRAFEL